MGRREVQFPGVCLYRFFDEVQIVGRRLLDRLEILLNELDFLESLGEGVSLVVQPNACVCFEKRLSSAPAMLLLMHPIVDVFLVLVRPFI